MPATKLSTVQWTRNGLAGHESLVVQLGHCPRFTYKYLLVAQSASCPSILNSMLIGLGLFLGQTCLEG